MKYCKKCLMPSSRPGLIYDDEGVCMACRYAEYKNEINWKARLKEFIKLLNKYKSKGGEYDCIVPWSSGKDSSAVAHRLKYEFGMNPLLVRVAPQVGTEEGAYNIEEFLNQGFNQILVTPDVKVQKQLARKFFFEKGDGWFAWSRAVHTVPYRIATALKIPLIVYAEHGESEYGGKVVKKKDEKERDTDYADDIFDSSPKDWGIPKKDLQFYMYPDKKEMKKIGVKAIYFGYYNKWCAYHNLLYAKKHWNFKTVKAGHTIFKLPGLTKKGRTEGTFTNFDSIDDKLDNFYYYFQFIKFGFGRSVRDASRAIHAGLITREEGLKLSKRYDGEFPKRYFKEFLRWMEITEKEFWKTVEKFRDHKIWKKKWGKWKLKHPLR